MNLVLYDGVCGLCNRLTRFVIERDTNDRFRFAALQNPLARELLARYGRNALDLDTVYVVADHQGQSERLLNRGRAILFIVEQLGGLWRAARVLTVFPDSLLDLFYRFVARNRYGWFGVSDACVVPNERIRNKFLD